MSSLFSHASEPVANGLPVPEPRTASVSVPIPIDDAFDGFTDGIHLWWPMDSHSTYGVEAHVAFERNHLIEDSFTGVQQLWAEVESWEVPTSFSLKWRLGGSPLTPTHVSVNFTAESEHSTVITLIQDGWAPGAAGLEQYEKYCDWPLILSRFARFMGATEKLD